MLAPVLCERSGFDKKPDKMEAIREREIPPSNYLWASLKGVHKSNLLQAFFFIVLLLLIFLSVSQIKGQNFLLVPQGLCHLDFVPDSVETWKNNSDL